MDELLHGEIEEWRAGSARAVDDRMLWVWWPQPAATGYQHNWLPALELPIADLHARYERACLEE